MLAAQDPLPEEVLCETLVRRALALRDEERKAMTGRYARYMAAVKKLDELVGHGAASVLDAQDHELARLLAIGQYQWIETLTPEAEWCDTPFQGDRLVVLLGLQDCLAERGVPEECRAALLVKAANMRWEQNLLEVLIQETLSPVSYVCAVFTCMCPHPCILRWQSVF